MGLQPLKSHLVLEGNEIVIDNPDMVITDDSTFKTNLPCVRGGDVLSGVVTQALGFELSKYESDYCLCRWFDKKLGWLDQVWVGIPIMGMMTNGMGAAVQSGMCGCFTRSVSARALFAQQELHDILQELGHSGWVTLRMSSQDSKTSSIETGIPGTGLYNTLEGIPGTLSEVLTQPENYKYLESWSVSLVVSKFPWPLPPAQHSPGRSQIRGLSDEKHFWLTDHSRFRNSLYTQNNLIGVATGWSRTLSEANSRVVRTCRSLEIDEIQFRTDAGYVASTVMGKIRASGFLES